MFAMFTELPPTPVNPCEPSPCGPNSICVQSGETPACSCQPSFIGAPPNCRPECTISAECPAVLACVALRCKDPCVQACGPRAVCSVVDHRATCACERGLEGDPFQGCAPPKGKTKIKLNYILIYTFYIFTVLKYFKNKTVKVRK